MEQKIFFCGVQKKMKSISLVGIKNSLLRVWQVFILKCAHQINISATEPDFYERWEIIGLVTAQCSDLTKY